MTLTKIHLILIFTNTESTCIWTLGEYFVISIHLYIFFCLTICETSVYTIIRFNKWHAGVFNPSYGALAPSRGQPLLLQLNKKTLPRESCS